MESVRLRQMLGWQSSRCDAPSVWTACENGLARRRTGAILNAALVRERARDSLLDVIREAQLSSPGSHQPCPSPRADQCQSMVPTWTPAGDVPQPCALAERGRVSTPRAWAPVRVGGMWHANVWPMASCACRSGPHDSPVAHSRVRADVWPLPGGFSLTPARRALESPMAMALFVERAPCLPFRTCSISSRTNSPACVVGALPCRFALRARCNVFCSGMLTSRVADCSAVHRT